MEHKGRSLISAAAVFLGLLFPLRFPGYFWQILVLVSILCSVMVFWVFGERPNLRRLKEDWFTIIFLFFFVFVSALFAYLLPNPIVQALILGSIGVLVYFVYQVASRLKRGYKPSLLLRNITFYTAIFGVFFSISDVLRWNMIIEYELATIILMALSFVSIFIISEYLFEVYGYEKSLLYSLVLSFTISQLVWLSSFWLITYPQSERAAIVGVPMPAILSAIFFYLLWGVSNHHLEGKLTRKVLWEYIFFSATFVIILFMTAKWTVK